jgi:hypothetical protein
MSPLKEIQNPPDNSVTNSWDDWVPQDRVRKFTDENKELAANLHNQMKELQRETRAPKSGLKKGGRANGSDFSSARGSEERHTSMAAQSGRGGPRRNRDYDLEPVSISYILIVDGCLSFFRFSRCIGLGWSHRGGARKLYQRRTQYLLYESLHSNMHVTASALGDSLLQTEHFGWDLKISPAPTKTCRQWIPWAPEIQQPRFNSTKSESGALETTVEVDRRDQALLSTVSHSMVIVTIVFSQASDLAR